MNLEIDPKNSTVIDHANFGDIDLIVLSSSEEFLFGEMDKLILRDHKLICTKARFTSRYLINIVTNFKIIHFLR